MGERSITVVPVQIGALVCRSQKCVLFFYVIIEIILQFAVNAGSIRGYNYFVASTKKISLSVELVFYNKIFEIYS